MLGELAPFGARVGGWLSPHATRTIGPRAVGLPHFKASGLVQTFGLPALESVRQMPG